MASNSLPSTSIWSKLPKEIRQIIIEKALESTSRRGDRMDLVGSLFLTSRLMAVDLRHPLKQRIAELEGLWLAPKYDYTAHGLARSPGVTKIWMQELCGLDYDATNPHLEDEVRRRLPAELWMLAREYDNLKAYVATIDALLQKSTRFCRAQHLPEGLFEVGEYADFMRMQQERHIHIPMRYSIKCSKEYKDAVSEYAPKSVRMELIADLEKEELRADSEARLFF